MKMARLYVREHGDELLEFMRQNEILSLEENESNRLEELAPAEEVHEHEEYYSQEPEAQSQWSIRSILQWIWGKITSQGSNEEVSETPERDEEELDHVLPYEKNDALSPVLVHSIVAVSMLMIAAVVFARAK